MEALPRVSSHGARAFRETACQGSGVRWFCGVANLTGVAIGWWHNPVAVRVDYPCGALDGSDSERSGGGAASLR